MEGCFALLRFAYVIVIYCMWAPDTSKSIVMQVSTQPVVVTIVDRPYRVGRHILNVQDLQARVMLKWPDAVVQVVHIEGLDLKQQISLFHSTSILVWTHGAAMADLLFLPQVLPSALLVSAISHLQCRSIFTFWIQQSWVRPA